MSDTRYPYTHACDYVRGHVTDFNSAIGIQTPTLSRSEASQAIKGIAAALGLTHEALACKLADAFLGKPIATQPPQDERSCTCHPDDNPPVPCAKKYAIAECCASAPAQQANEPVGEIVLFGKHLKEVSWRQGKMPEPGAKLYATPPQPVAAEVTTAPKLLLERAAEMCEWYAEFIRDNVMSVDIERHPYRPELEGIAEDLRALSGTGSDESKKG